MNTNNCLEMLLDTDSLRSAMSSLDSQQLKFVKNKINDVIDDCLAVKIKESLDYTNKLAEYRELLALEGISANELLGDYSSSFSKNKKRWNKKTKTPASPFKYRYESEGLVRFWSGRGRMPSVMKTAIESGKKNLCDFLIID